MHTTTHPPLTLTLALTTYLILTQVLALAAQLVHATIAFAAAEVGKTGTEGGREVVEGGRGIDVDANETNPITLTLYMNQSTHTHIPQSNPMYPYMCPGRRLVAGAGALPEDWLPR